MDQAGAAAAFVFLAGIGWIASGFIGWACGRTRDQAKTGFYLGLFLGPLGWVLSLFLPAPLDRDRK